MIRSFPFFIFSILLIGCASQPPELIDEEGEALPAPVRESSIVAPVEEEEVILATEVEILGQQGEELSEAAGLEEPLTQEQQVTPPSPVEISQPAVTAEIETVETEDALNARVGKGAVAGAASALLNSGTVSGGQPMDSGEAKEESDVTSYLLDEAENSFERENYEKARGQSERALTLEPSAARAYLILARIEIIEGRPEKAAEMARNGLASNSDSDEIFEQLNQVLAEVEDMKPMPIPQIIEEVQELAPSSASPTIPL